MTCGWRCGMASSSPARRSPTTSPASFFTQGLPMRFENIMRRVTRGLTKAMLSAAAAAVVAGCQSAHVAQPAMSKLGGDVRAMNAPEGQVEFWHTLNAQPLASNDDAFH